MLKGSSAILKFFKEIFEDMPPYVGFIAGVVLVLLLINGAGLLAFRTRRLKYWGIDAQNRTLLEINQKLGMMTEKEDGDAVRSEVVAEETNDEQEDLHDTDENGVNESEEGIKKEELEAADRDKDDKKELGNVGNAGRVYTEEELIELIRF